VWADNTTAETLVVNGAGNYSVIGTDANGCTASANTTISSNTTPPSVSVTPTSGTLTCTTTSILLTASGADSYTWNGGASGATRTASTSGTYTVTGTSTSNGCSATASATISSNTTAPNVNAGADQTLTCTTTSVNLLASSTTTGATFQWTGGPATAAYDNIATAATYTVTATNPANGCTASDEVIVNQDITVPTVTCPSGSTMCSTASSFALSGASPSGGTYTGTGVSSGNFDPAVAGAGTHTITYSYTGTNGCIGSCTYDIIVVSPVTISSQPTSTSVLPGSNATFSVTASGTGLSYLWQQSTDGINWTSASSQSFGDNASNYGGGWSSGSNQGTGFGPWSITAGAGAGTFTGNPSADGMGTSGIGTNSFAAYATGSGYANINRPLATSMQVGDVLSFWWTMNWDAGSGNKGFDLKAGSSTVFNVNNTGSATISGSNGTINTNYGTAPMQVTLTRTSSSAYDFTMTSRSGGSTYATTINSSLAVNLVGFYIGGQPDNAGQRNIYFNNFNVSKAVSGSTSSTLTVPSVIAAQSGNKYRCIVSGNSPCGSVTSNEAMLTVASTIISAQPQNQTICSSASTASFIITTSGATPTYQWQVSTDNGASFSNISGATGTTLSLTGLTTASSGNQYRCQINGSTNSSAATLTVNAVPSVSISSATSTLTCTTTSITLTASGADSYVWSDNSTGNTLSVSAAGNYSVIGTAANGCTASAIVTVGSNTTPPSVTCPSSSTVCSAAAAYTLSGGSPYG
jgi:hypothetical protein